MSVKHYTCIAISCDACDYTYDQDEDGQVHFDDIAEAQSMAKDVDWFIGADGIALCGEADEEHVAQARVWIDAGKLNAEELATLGRWSEAASRSFQEAARILQEALNESASVIDGQLALAGTASEVSGE